MFNRIRYIVLMFGMIFVTADSVFALQYARPNGIVSSSGWSPVGASTIWEATDESSPDDNDYMIATDAAAGELHLSDVTDPGVDTGHTIRFRMTSTGSGGPEKFNARLLDGTTEIDVHNNLSSRGSYTTFSYALNTADVANISDYSNLRFEVSTTSVGNGEEIRISWIELEVPDAAAATEPTVTTGSPSSIDTTTATLGGDVTDTGGDPVTERGAYWSTSSGFTPPGEGTPDSTTGGPWGTGGFTEPVISLPVGSQVYFISFAANSIGAGYGSESSFFTEPLQASTIGFENITDTDMRITWTAGTGGATVSSMVIVRQVGAVNFVPVDGTTYTPNSDFGNGTPLNTDNYAVYNGTGTQVDITGLSAETTYFVAVYAHVGSGSPINYQQDGAPTASQKTDPGVVAPTLIDPSVTSIDTGSATLGATIDTDGGSAITSRGTVWGTSAAPVTNLLAEGGTAIGVSYTHGRTGLYEGTLIYYRGYATNADDTGYSSDDTFYTEPGQASTIGFSNIGDTAMRITWTAGTSDGTYGATVNSIVIVKQGSAVTQAPADGDDTYSAGTSVFNDGTDLGGGEYEYVVFNGVGTQVDITGLTAETIYHVTVYASVGPNVAPITPINYQQDGAPTASQTTGAAAVLATLSTPPTATAIDTTSATLEVTIDSDGGGTITQHGTYWNATGAPITENQSSLGAYGGSIPGSFTDARTGLYEGTLIYYRGYADNSAGRAYSSNGSFYTEPVQASGVGFANVLETEMRITWTPGTSDVTYGETVGSIVVVKQGGVVTQAPTDGMEHTANSVFGTGGTDLGGGEYVVFRGIGTQVDITGLTDGLTYYVAVYAYVGLGANYNQNDTPATGTKTTGSAGPVAPTVSNTTVSNVTTTTATLGGDVTSTGGEPVTERGVYWSGILDFTPPGEGTKDSTTGGPWGTGGFTEPVASLPFGSQVYYRAFAANSAGDGYASEASFYTEPTQVSPGVTFSFATHKHLGIIWTAGTSDATYGAEVGAVVVAKQGSAVTQVPVDGTEYTSAAFGTGTDLGGGEYVVYSGTSSDIVFRGLTANTIYHVAVYSYVGSGGLINYQQDSPATGNETTGPLSHNDAHGITDCLTCHAMHDGVVPHGSEQITACVDNCHSPGNPAEAKSDVSLHTADGGATIIDCGSCHDVHAYDFQTTDTHSGSVTALNISRIRWNTSRYEVMWSTPGAVLEPALFQQRPGHFAFDETAYPSGPYNGICQSCHTRVTKHTNDGWDTDAGADADNDHEKGSDCTSCHLHESNFSGAGGGCITCHASDTDAGDGLPTRRAVVDEFGVASHHVVGGTITDEDCGVCHMESEVDHKNNLIDLRDPDTGTALTGFATLTRNRSSSTIESTVIDVQDNFCMKCHDLLGATGAGVPVEGGTALQPFSFNSKDVPNVFDQFDTSHDQFHPVRGAGSNPFCTSTATNGDNVTMLSPWNQNPDDHDVISCFDCHEVNGHGSANQRMLTVDIDFDDMMLGNLVTTTMGYPIREFCFTCHDQAVYLDAKNPEDLGSGFTDHGGALSNHRLTNNVLSCMGCHAGPYDHGGLTGSNGATPGLIHGGSYTWTENGDFVGQSPEFFVLGGYISGSYSTGGGNGKCGGGTCSHPGGKTYTY